MNKNNTGSLLLWSMFFVMFVSFSFLYISNKIKLSINKSSQISFDDYFYSFKNNNLNNTTNENQTVKIQNINSYSGSFINGKSKSFSFTKSNTGVLNILYGGPILYYISPTNSGVVYDVKTFNFSLGNKITLTNLGGYTNFGFNFETSSGIIFPDNYYTITKNIGGQEIISDIVKY